MRVLIFKILYTAHHKQSVSESEETLRVTPPYKRANRTVCKTYLVICDYLNKFKQNPEFILASCSNLYFWC